MITQIQKNLEDSFYKSLGKAGFGQDIVEKYPDKSAEILADWLTEGLKTSKLGPLIRSLGVSLPGYDLECIGAFREAVRRLIEEARDQG